MKQLLSCTLMALLSTFFFQSNAQQKKTTKNNAMNISNTTTAKELTQVEREYALEFIKKTEADVFNAAKDLTEAQLTFKPAPDKWSVEDCLKHIAAAESNLWAMVDASLKQQANPEQRTGIKFTDEELIKAVENRSQKSKTFAALEPANSPDRSAAEALASFKKNREKLIAFVESTHEDLRNHVSVLPIGTYDAYQFILLIAAHTNRHTQQINEVKNDAGFPRK
ncbi:DinB family protein [Mucilaginibacter terrenus]|uniref:DinB family protein n=1 Tax=Mucilaginibacter terrenus TaxID=2482727 RepID=A0A3E2NU06_9SPHI|nr:DinB family protein [Mucilaginibacter terrenus]RFZ84496.1 DinB family protein [Mucilaginibacter terrenus]